MDLLCLSNLEILQGLLVKLQILVQLILELRQLHQVQLCQVDGLHLRRLGHF